MKVAMEATRKVTENTTWKRPSVALGNAKRVLPFANSPLLLALETRPTLYASKWKQTWIFHTFTRKVRFCPSTQNEYHNREATLYELFACIRPIGCRWEATNRCRDIMHRCGIRFFVAVQVDTEFARGNRLNDERARQHG